MELNASAMEYDVLNAQIRAIEGDVTLTDVCGQRFIGAGLSGREITIEGVPGNALGAYLNGANITVHGNAQDAVGDTMNEGEIIIHGNIGDAAGYAMRGGTMYIRGNAGYRAGIHMKEYKEKRPVIVIGGCTGSFLAEYQAGGRIVVLGLDCGDAPIVGGFPCTGMHGGKLFLRGDCTGVTFPAQVTKRCATEEDMEEIKPYLQKFADCFGYDATELLESHFTVVVPDSSNPYKQLYVAN